MRYLSDSFTGWFNMEENQYVVPFYVCNMLIDNDLIYKKVLRICQIYALANKMLQFGFMCLVLLFVGYLLIMCYVIV